MDLKNNLRNLVGILELKKKEYQLKVEEYEKKLSAVQILCNHEWECTGNDSHKDHFECNICKARRTE